MSLSLSMAGLIRECSLFPGSSCKGRLVSTPVSCRLLTMSTPSKQSFIPGSKVIGIHYHASKSTGRKRHMVEINCNFRVVTLSAVELPSFDLRIAGRLEERSAG